MPVKLDDDKIYPDPSKYYSPEQLTTLIGKYSDYRDIIECEILVEYGDYAIDMLQGNSSQLMPTFVVTLADLRHVYSEWRLSLKALESILLSSRLRVDTSRAVDIRTKYPHI